MALVQGIMSREEALEAARSVLRDRFAEANFAYVAGSIMRGTATPSSDIDLVVIYPDLPHARRESLTFEDRPVEALVHDGGTLRWFMDADVKAGRPVLIRMVAEGIEVGPRPQGADLHREHARLLLAEGPPPLDRETLDRFRYDITDKLNDLRDERPDQERMAIGAALYIALGDFILRSNGAWSGAGKWLPRELIAFDASVGNTFVTAFDALFRDGRTTPILEFAERCLAPHGGLLFDGYRSDAPAAWRR